MDGQKEKIALKIRSVRNLRLKNNVSIGYDKLADIEHVDSLKAEGNVALSDRENHQGIEPWYKKPLGQIGIGLIIAILAGLIVARATEWL